MPKLLYSDRQGALEKLISDENYEVVVEIFDGERQLIAGLFNLRRKDGER